MKKPATATVTTASQQHTVGATAPVNIQELSARERQKRHQDETTFANMMGGSKKLLLAIMVWDYRQ